MSSGRNASAGSDVEQLFQAIARRDPSKRQIKPVSSSQFALFDELDSDSDSEFVCDEKDDEGDSDIEESDEAPSGSDSDVTDSSSESSKDSSEGTLRSPVAETKDADINLYSNTQQDTSNDVEMEPKEIPPTEHCPDSVVASAVMSKDKVEVPQKDDFLICMVCLRDNEDPNDELIECDGCGVVVHEGQFIVVSLDFCSDCYKIVDSIFLSSGASSSSTDAWFCEACLAGVFDPLCELCPNTNGAFKRTDNNRWVHLICALYTPGVAFNDPENLMDVTLTELSPKSWSAHECSLCEESFFAWTGVCIACDAGLCRTFFHVTCAQKHGLLSEPAVDENTVDPFFAQCRQHTDKTVARHRRRNYLTAMSHLRKRSQSKSDNIGANGFGSPLHIPTSGELKLANHLEPRVQQKLETFRNLYKELLKIREKPYVPPSKTPLFLENSPVAMRFFVTKAKSLQLPLQLTGQSTTNDPVKATPSGYPVFSPDFITYFFEREKRITEVSKRIAALQNTKRELQIADESASHSYNSVTANWTFKCISRRTAVHVKVRQLMKQLANLIPVTAQLDAFISRRTAVHVKVRQLMNSLQNLIPVSLVKTILSGASTWIYCLAIALWAVPAPAYYGFAGRVSLKTALLFFFCLCSTRCVVCHGLQDQHLITKCDTCGKAFHLACLDPPLLRMPKRSKLYGWQCSHCTKAVASNTEVVVIDINAPRQLRRSAGRPSDLEKTSEELGKPPGESTPVAKIESVLPKPEPTSPSVTSAPTMRTPGRQRPIFTTPRSGLSTTAVGNRITTSHRGRRKQSFPSRDSSFSAVKKLRTEQQSQQSQSAIPGSLSTQPTIVVSQMDLSTITKTQRSDTICATVKPLMLMLTVVWGGGIHLLPRLLPVKLFVGLLLCLSFIQFVRCQVIKFVQIRDHGTNGDSETVEQIAPLHMRYMICPENTGMQRRSSAGRFRMRLKKL
ncbi:PHD finger protein 14 [Fasciola gigantica]|uniref:PHD finger protein 14 n=1 Tax=Fasciola gigantica TaxID=46835 RepID=A0A504ZC67_FASGI|nr:PHD finger protein 14 [Fasciola gigantica]